MRKGKCGALRAMIFLDGMKMERNVIALMHEDPVDLPLAQPSRLGQQFFNPCDKRDQRSPCGGLGVRSPHAIEKADDAPIGITHWLFWVQANTAMVLVF